MAVLNKQIEPVIIFQETGTTLCCEVLHYDLAQTNCEVNWWLLNSNGSLIHNERWFVPQTVLEQWGQDDTIIIQALADEKNFTIIN